MNPKGQLFSVGFLLAMGLLILVLGVLMSYANRQAFELHRQQTDHEFNQVGQTATLFLTSNPALTCKLVANAQGNASLNMNINNCLDWTKLSALTPAQIKQELGIPAAYLFRISASGFGVVEDAPNSGVSGFFSSDASLVVLNGNLSKADYYTCLKKEPCPLTTQTRIVTLEVWK